MKYKLILIFALITSMAKGQEFVSFSFEGRDAVPGNAAAANPVIGGWSSDPSVCRVGDDYWLVTSSFGYFPGVPLYHSKNLRDWTLVRNILDRPSQLPYLKGQGIARDGIYAPHISYNPHNGLYYMITTDVGHGTFYVTAKDPASDWSEPVWLPDVDGIDPSFFFDDDGKAYIVHKEDVTGQPKWNLHRAIRIIRFDTATGTTFGEDVPFCEEGVGPEEKLGRDEGPHIYKVNGKYIMICAEGGTGINHSEVCYKADSVFGPYTRWSRNPMLTQRLLNGKRTNPVTCSGHVDMVQTPSGEWYGVFLAERGYESLHGRETFLMPVCWSKDGFPYITQEKDTVPLNPRNYTFFDDFKTRRPDWITAEGVPGAQMIRLPNTKFVAETSVVPPSRKSAGKPYGMVLLRDETHQYRIDVDGTAVNVVKVGKKGACETLAGVSLPRDKKPLLLRMVSDGETLRFYCNGEEIGTGAPVKYVGSRQAPGFTGSVIGIYK